MSYPSYAAVGWTDIAEEVTEELARARKKFPDSALVTTALSEEAGEAVRAVLECYYTASKRPADYAEARRALRKELIQTIAMCIRLEQEGDSVHRILPAEAQP